MLLPPDVKCLIFNYSSCLRIIQKVFWTLKTTMIDPHFYGNEALGEVFLPAVSGWMLVPWQKCNKGLLRDSGILAGAFPMLSHTAGAGAFAAIITNNIPGGNIQLQ